MKIRPGTSNTYTLMWEEGQCYLKDYVIDLIDYINRAGGGGWKLLTSAIEHARIFTCLSNVLVDIFVG